MNIKVLSWNIWGGKNKKDIINFLKNTEFDVAALQEVTEREVDGKSVNDAQLIADALGYHYIYAKSFTTDRHTPVYDMGNAIISKFPLSDVKTHVLSDLTTYEQNATTEPRNAVQADIEINEKKLTIVSTHLGYSETLQATPLQTKQIEKLISSIPRTKTLLMGDFNSEPTSDIIKTILNNFDHGDTDMNQPTWTNFKKEGNPRFHIDYMFHSKDVTVKTIEIKESSASDHLPIIAEIEVE